MPDGCFTFDLLSTPHPVDTKIYGWSPTPRTGTGRKGEINRYIDRKK
jgi:hypothetical protein